VGASAPLVGPFIRNSHLATNQTTNPTITTNKHQAQREAVHTRATSKGVDRETSKHTSIVDVNSQIIFGFLSLVPFGTSSLSLYVRVIKF